MEFINFNDQITEVRLSIDKAVAALMLKNDGVEIDLVDNEELISIDCEGAVVVKSVLITEIQDTFNITLFLNDGFEQDFLDCSTDEMMGIYEIIYRIVTVKFGK